MVILLRYAGQKQGFLVKTADNELHKAKAGEELCETWNLQEIST